MPTTVSDYAQTAQEQALKTVQQSQQAIVDAVKAWANAVEKTLPDVPALPYADELPQPKEIVQTSFEFAGQLLKLQQQFLESIVEAASPVLGKASEPVKSSGKAQADS
jgi:hypothetical protein